MVRSSLLERKRLSMGEEHDLHEWEPGRCKSTCSHPSHKQVSHIFNTGPVLSSYWEACQRLLSEKEEAMNQCCNGDSKACQVNGPCSVYKNRTSRRCTECDEQDPYCLVCNGTRLHSHRQAKFPPADYIDIVFDDGPGPVAGRFVEVEDSSGKSISVGEWVERPDGFWALRIKKGSI